MFTTESLVAQDFKFSYEVQKPSSSPFNLVLYELSKSFEEQNFVRFSKSPSGKIPFVHADEVLFSATDSRLIFISTQIIAPKDKQFKIIEENKRSLILYHTNEASIAFFGFNSFQVREFTKNLIKKKSVRFNPFDLFINTANARTDRDCLIEGKNNFGAILAVDDAIARSLISQKVRECLVGAFQGMKGQLTSSFDFFTKLKDDPMTLWDEIKKTYSELYKLTSNFSNEMQSLFKSLSQLDINLKLEIICQASGELAAGAITLLSGAGIAVGASKLVASFMPKMIRLKNLLEQFRLYKIPADAARDSLSCAI